MIRKRSQLDISRDILSRFEDDPCDFIERVVTQDETWVKNADQERTPLDNSRYIVSSVWL